MLAVEMSSSRSILKTVLLALAVLSVILVLRYGTHWRLLETGDGTYTMFSYTSDPSDTNPKLSPRVRNGVKKFVFFVGYPRSGHSIVGALMDAHPHVVIPHEYFLFCQFKTLDKASDETWRDNLFNILYKKSELDAAGSRVKYRKGYTLSVKGMWQGRFDGYIEVIGDKSGGRTTMEYIKDKSGFLRNYQKLKKLVSIPVRMIHVMRNPFDMVATSTIYHQNKVERSELLPKARGSSNVTVKKLNSPEILETQTAYYLKKFNAVVEMIENVFGKDNVLEIHNCDLVADPRGTLQKIFDFLEVDTTEHYLEVCAEKVFKSVS